MIVVVAILWVVLAFVTGRQAANKGLSQWGGILLGLLLGPLALAIVLLLPSRLDSSQPRRLHCRYKSTAPEHPA